MAELWEWAKNGQSPSTVGYPNDRSKAECALAAKLGYWLGRDRTAVKQALNTVNPPKWSERDDPSYRMSVLDAVDVVDNTFSGSEGGPDPEFVELVYGALCGLGQATTGEIAESDYIQCTERHTLDALDILEENGLITYEKSGRSGYWSVTDEIYLDDIDDLI